jgi:hypothetical protein
VHIPPALRDDLITYLLCTSPDRARIIAERWNGTPGSVTSSRSLRLTTISGRGSR